MKSVVSIALVSLTLFSVPAWALLNPTRSSAKRRESRWSKRLKLRKRKYRASLWK